MNGKYYEDEPIALTSLLIGDLKVSQKLVHVRIERGDFSLESSDFSLESSDFSLESSDMLLKFIDLLVDSLLLRIRVRMYTNMHSQFSETVVFGLAMVGDSHVSDGGQCQRHAVVWSVGGMGLYMQVGLFFTHSIQ